MFLACSNDFLASYLFIYVLILVLCIERLYCAILYHTIAYYSYPAQPRPSLCPASHAVLCPAISTLHRSLSLYLSSTPFSSSVATLMMLLPFPIPRLSSPSYRPPFHTDLSVVTQEPAQVYIIGILTGWVCCRVYCATIVCERY